MLRLPHRQVRRSASCLAAALALTFFVNSASAQKSYIGPGGTTTSPTSGNWNASANWSPSGVPANSAILSFGGSGSSTYTSTNNISNYVLGAVSLTSTSTGTDIIAGNSFNLGASSSISQDNTGAFAISNGFGGQNTQQTLTLTGNGTGLVTLSGVITEQNTSHSTILTKTGTSTFALSGANTFSGATSINAGIINYQNNSAFGSDAGTLSAITVASGATAQLQGGITSTANSLTISGTGASNATGALENVSGTNNYTGLVKLGAAATISSDSGTLNLTNTGTITGATFGLTLTGSGDGSISSIIGTTTGGVTKSGTGTWTLSGANTYSGATTINAGTLKLDNNNTTTARLANTSGIAVNSGGTLLLAQTGVASTDRINNAAGVTISGGGTFATGGLSEGTRPTNSSATNGAAGMGALTLQSTSSVSRATIDFLTGANGSTLAFSSLVGGNGAFLDIKNWTGTPFTDESATGNDRLLFGVDPGLTAAQLANVRFFDDSGAFIGAGEIIGYGNMFEMVAIPEPSTWLAAALALGAIGFSQRKRLRRLRVIRRSKAFLILTF